MRIVILTLAAISLVATASSLLPAPNRFLLPLTVGVPELSAWLFVGNLLALLLAYFYFPKTLVIFAAGLAVASWPLLQIDQAEAAVARQWQEQRFSDSPFQILGAARVYARSLLDAASGDIQPEILPQQIHLYRSTQAGELHPVIIDIYGGAWQRGSPSDDHVFASYMATRGYAVFAIDYRHAPQAKYPAQIDDVRQAMEWIYANAKQYGGDPSRIVLCGRSAGGQLALLAAYTSTNVPVSAVISFYGPPDLRAGYEDPPRPDPLDVRDVLETYLGGSPSQVPNSYRDASPAKRVQAKSVPTLQLQGARDHIVKARFARELHEKLLSTGTPSLLLELPWSEHSFDAVFSGIGNVVALNCVEQFLNQTLSGKP